MSEFPYAFARTVERVFRLPNHMAARAVFDLEVTGKEHVPQTGPVIVAANHFSHLDPPLIGTNLDRYVRFLAVDDLYGRNRLFDTTLAFFGAIPLDRDGYPVRALRTAIAHLQGGNAIGIFPEGRRAESWGAEPPKLGAAWLSWMTGAPVLPVAIHGTQDSMSPEMVSFARTAVRIWIDEPLMWHRYAESSAPLRSMMDDWYETVDAHLAPWRRHDT